MKQWAGYPYRYNANPADIVPGKRPNPGESVAEIIYRFALATSSAIIMSSATIQPDNASQNAG